MSDDDWETDPDFTNDLTEKQQRAFGNQETMQKYNSVMDKAGGSIPGEAPKISLAPKPSPASMQPVDLSDGLLQPARSPAPTPAPAPAFSSPPRATPPAAPPPPPQPLAGTPPSLGSARTATPGRLHIPATLQGTNNTAGSSASQQPPPPLGSTHGGSQRGLGSARGAVHNRTRRVSDLGSRKLQEVFQSFDTDGSGSIEQRELEGAMAKLGMPSDAEKIVAMLKEVDLDGNGRITFSEV